MTIPAHIALSVREFLVKLICKIWFLHEILLISQQSQVYVHSVHGLLHSMFWVILLIIWR
jgi:hypothetical protein